MLAGHGPASFGACYDYGKPSLSVEVGDKEWLFTTTLMHSWYRFLKEHAQVMSNKVSEKNIVLSQSAPKSFPFYPYMYKLPIKGGKVSVFYLC